VPALSEENYAKRRFGTGKQTASWSKIKRKARLNDLTENWNLKTIKTKQKREIEKNEM